MDLEHQPATRTSTCKKIMSKAIKWIIWWMMLWLRIFLWPVTSVRRLRKKRVCPPINDRLLLMPATDLARLIRTRQVTCTDVVQVFIYRVQEVNPLVNAVVQERFQEALAEAREIDDLLDSGRLSQEHLETNMPLMGVPLTVKESVGVKGMSNNAAFSIQPEYIAKEDSEIIRLLREAGAIPLLVSNTPELCMCWETFNPRTGTTNNPYDTRRTPAGSSGGEAALLGSGASVIGVGSDIGGSLRLPAAFTSVYGHKPTPGYVSNAGHRPTSKDEQWDHYFTVGPMCRYATDLPLMLRLIVSDKNRARELRLEEQVDVSKLKIFYMEEDTPQRCRSITSRVNPEIKAALRNAVAHLHNKYGCPVQQVSIKEVADVLAFSAFLMLRMNGIPNVYQKSEETPDEWNSVTLTVLKRIFCMSNTSLTALCYAPIKYLADSMSDKDFQKLLNKKERLMNRFQEMLGEDGVFLYPAFPDVAHFHGQIFYKILDPAYLVLFNVLELPATACPLGLNREGMPIGIQISAWQKQDRLTFAVAQALEKEFGGWKPPSHSQV